MESRIERLLERERKAHGTRHVVDFTATMLLKYPPPTVIVVHDCELITYTVIMRTAVAVFNEPRKLYTFN